MNLASNLNQGLRALQLNLSDATQTQLLDYIQLLDKWNQVYNLTGVRQPADMIPKHIFDCLAILPYVCGREILDIGTGAGLPGLLLAIARPDWHCVLLDSSAKKIRFVKQAILELEITNAEVVCTRLEAFKPTYKFNTIVSRAYSNLLLFYTQSAHLCTSKGCLLAMKGIYPNEEIAKISGVQIETIALKIPQLQAQRHLIIMRPQSSR
jgi:16S rRNA (guanine527-N7)-methyltransferase